MAAIKKRSHFRANTWFILFEVLLQEYVPIHIFYQFLCNTVQILTLNSLTWKIWWAHNNASRWQMGFNSAFRGLKRVHICYAFMLWTVIKSVTHIHQIHVYFSELHKQKCATFSSSFCASTTVHLTWKTCLWFLIPVATSSEDEIQKIHSHEYFQEEQYIFFPVLLYEPERGKNKIRVRQRLMNKVGHSSW